MSIPFLVKDIKTSSFGWSSGNSYPGTLITVGNTLFFTADDGVNGRELWKSDGTEMGTVLIKDIRPGVSNSSPSNLTAVGNTLFFTANDGVNGYELWRSDGTETGTILVKDIRPGASNSSSPKNLIAMGNTLFFTANDGVNGYELWRSDGTATGTVLIKDIHPFSNSNPASLITVGNTLYFAATNNVNGRELWKSYGTEAGTVLVKDILPTIPFFNSSYINYLTAVGNTLYFSATNGVNGKELWKSDGTETGTVLVKDIHPFSNSSPRNLTAVGNTLFFTAIDNINGIELWKSDGTEAGTVLIKDIIPGFDFAAPTNLTGVGNTLFFSVNNGVNGYELWKSDGTATGTVLVKDIRLGSDSSSPRNLTAVGNTLFFTANDGVNGDELWKSDGTVTGTVLAGNISFGANSSFIGNLTVVGNTLFFTANDLVNGNELWALNVDNPSSASLAISATSAAQTEGNSGGKAFTFTVIRSGATTETNNVNWAVTGTGTNPANATDFVGGVLPSGVVSFGAGETSKVITVNVQGDTTVELNETFAVTLSNPTNGATITTATAQGTIQNDDISVSPVESFGNTKLVKDGTNKLYAQVGNNSPVAIKNGATQITTTLSPGWQTLAAETVNGVNQVLWKNTSGNYLHLWRLDNNWNFQSSTGQWGLNSPEAFTQEANFQQDFNGDGIVGQPYTAVESFGNTKLVKDGTNKLYAQVGNNSPVAIKNGATQLTTTLSPGWQTLAAETVNGVNQVLWKNTAGNYLHLWRLDSNWTLQSSTGQWGLNSAEAFTQEANFQQDFNGDGIVGQPYTSVESFGNTKLVKDATNKLYAQVGNNSPVAIKNGATQITTTLSPGWQTLAAETVNGVNQVLWKNTSGNYLHLWRLDNNWNFQSSTGQWGLNSPEAFTQEANFQQDFNGDGAIGQLYTSGNDILTSGASADTLTGGAGNDTFVFRFGQSTVTALDRITDFTIGADKIDLLTQGGAELNAPVALTRAADSATTNINTIVTNVFTDANGALAGNQMLGLNSAALVRANTSTYLIVNDGAAGFQSAHDLVINLTGITGTLPAFGSIPVANFFV